MLRMGAKARRGLRWNVLGLVTGVAALTWSDNGARAAPYAEIVVDGNSGGVLHSTNPDALRHPASLTKIMTLYLLFEQLEAGKLKLDSPLKVSEYAAGQSPTKLGLRPGSTLAVEDAIKGMVTRSANDAAVVVAEAIAGDERQFAKLMTQTAHALGMSRSVYRNASGLPDDDQVTTARDQSILGRAIQERFPRYYKYFSTRSFSFRGQWIGNHNHLLGRVEGVDGIKTGYTHASGFNLVTSVHRGNRYLVAVVMGGSSGGSRDARMRELVNSKLALASTKKNATSVVAEEARPEVKPAAARIALASAASTPVSVPAARTEAAPPPPPSSLASAAATLIASGSTEPIRPIVVKTVTVRTARAQTASFAPLQAAALPLAEAAKPPAPSAPATAEPIAINEAMPPAAAATTKAASVIAAPLPAPVKDETTPAGNRSDIDAAPASEQSKENARAAADEPSGAARAKLLPRGGWMIQVGAYPAEQEAKHRLAMVQSKAAKMLSRADPFTESVEKGGTTYYRARFAGLDKEKAEAACKFLKRSDVDCVAIKN